MKNPWENGAIDPEVRTREFFAQNFDELAGALRGMTIAVKGSQNRIVIAETDPFERKTNERGVYKPLLEMTSGRLAAIDYPFRRAVLPLVSAKEGEQAGACVRILSADIYSNGSTKRVKRGADILEHLGIETGTSPRLVFMDPSNTLFVMKENPAEAEGAQGQPNSNAGQELDKFMDGFGI